MSPLGTSPVNPPSLRSTAQTARPAKTVIPMPGAARVRPTIQSVSARAEPTGSDVGGSASGGVVETMSLAATAGDGDAATERLGVDALDRGASDADVAGRPTSLPQPAT